MQNLAARLVLTLAYTSQFKFPLTTQELQLRLVSPEAGEGAAELLPKNWKKKVHWLGEVGEEDEMAEEKDRLETVLAKLAEEQIVQGEHNYWILNSVLDQDTLSDLIKQRQRSKQHSAQLKARLKPLLRLVRHCSWIKAVAVTGSAAAESADEKADLDLMIVVQDWLWLTRWLLLIWALISGKKSWPWQKEQDQWCFNVFLKQDELALLPSKRNLYFAYEVCQTDWIYDDSSIRCDFLQANQWVKFYLPNWYEQLTQSAADHKSGSAFSSDLIKIIPAFFKQLNLWSYRLQKRHLQRKNNIPLHNMSLGQAFLHDDVSYKKYLQLALAEK